MGLGFENPAWLLGAGLIAPLVWLYLRVRPRPPAVVSSLRIWHRVPSPSTPPRTRPKLPPLFFVQAALILAAAAALSGPYRREPRPPGPPRDAVVVVDVSASMQSREDGSTRFDRAMRRASARVRELADEGRRITLLRAGLQPEVVATGLGAEDAQASLESLHPLDTTANLTAAIELAASLAGHEGSVDVFSDVDPAGIVMSSDARRLASVHTFGAGGDNVAVRDVRVQQSRFEQDGRSRILVGLRSYSTSPREVAVDVVPLDDRSVAVPASASTDEEVPALTRSLTLEPRGQATVPFDDVPFTGAFEARLRSSDDLALDDVVYGYVPRTRRTDVLLVSDDAALGRKLAWLAERAGTFSVRTTTPRKYDPSAVGEITLFDRFVPKLPPPSNAAYLAPAGGNADVTVIPDVGTIRIAEKREHPLLRGVSSTDGLVGAHPVGLGPGSLRPILLGRSEGREVALVQAGEVGGRRIAAAAFRIDASELTRPDDLPALIFTLNLLSFLSPESADAPLLRTTGERLRAGSRLAAPIEELSGPDGTHRLSPGADIALERAGVYEARSRSGTTPVLVSCVDDGESDILRRPREAAPPRPDEPEQARTRPRATDDESSWTHVPYLRPLLAVLAFILVAEWVVVAATARARASRPARTGA